MTLTGSIKVALLASVVGVPMACMPAMAQQPQKPNVVFILIDNVGYGDLGPTAAASSAEHRRRGSTSSPARVCASRSTWSNLPAHRRARH